MKLMIKLILMITLNLWLIMVITLKLGEVMMIAMSDRILAIYSHTSFVFRCVLASL